VRIGNYITMVLPPGLEPGFSAPEADALSIELWELMGKIKKDEKGQWSIAIGATSYKCTDL
jgi:hypothetical protein